MHRAQMDLALVDRPGRTPGITGTHQPHHLTVDPAAEEVPPLLRRGSACMTARATGRPASARASTTGVLHEPIMKSALPKHLHVVSDTPHGSFAKRTPASCRLGEHLPPAKADLRGRVPGGERDADRNRGTPQTRSVVPSSRTETPNAGQLRHERPARCILAGQTCFHRPTSWFDDVRVPIEDCRCSPRLSAGGDSAGACWGTSCAVDDARAGQRPVSDGQA